MAVLAIFLNCLAPALAAASMENEGQKPADITGARLKGHVIKKPPPFLTGSLSTVETGTKVELTLTGNLNSEVNQKGDEIFARVAVTVKDGDKIMLPEGWYVHGLVTDIEKQKRLGRNGWVEIEFDRLISPDGEYELPFAAKVSTRDNRLKAVGKTVAIDAGYVSVGALGGTILSAQLTGIPVAIATEGYSLAIGAAIGAGIGAIGALKRKGKIQSFYPGDNITLTIAEPLALPEFKQEAIRSVVHKGAPVSGLTITVNKAKFRKDPFGDKRSRLLTLDVTVDNKTKRPYSFFDLAIVSDHNQLYYPSMFTEMRVWRKKVLPNKMRQATVRFSVDTPKHKYWIVMLDRQRETELARTPVN